MPILDVEVIVRPGEVLRSELAGELADRAGEVLGTPAGSTWVKVRAIEAGHYAENRGGPPAGLYPVFVSILKARLPAPGALQAEVTLLTAAIAEVCARPPENVHLFYHPEGVGRVAFGGKVVSD